MGLFDFFKKNKRTLILTRADYELCSRKRREQLDSFREKARAYLKFKYPNSIILMNNIHTGFIILNRTMNHIHQGEFADYYAPFLAHVRPDAEYHELIEALYDYKEQVNLWQSGSLIKEHEFYYCHDSDWSNEFNKNGFYLKDDYRYGDVIDVESLFGISIYLNGIQIAFSSIWRRKSAGYFAECIFKEIINSKQSTTTGLSVITVVVGCFTIANEECVGCETPNKIHFEIYFGNGEALSDPNYNSDSKQCIISLRDFLDYVENKLPSKDSRIYPISTPEQIEMEIYECHAVLNDQKRKKHHPGIETMYAK